MGHALVAFRDGRIVVEDEDRSRKAHDRFRCRVRAQKDHPFSDLISANALECQRDGLPSFTTVHSNTFALDGPYRGRDERSERVRLGGKQSRQKIREGVQG